MRGAIAGEADSLRSVSVSILWGLSTADKIWITAHNISQLPSRRYLGVLCGAWRVGNGTNVAQRPSASVKAQIHSTDYPYYM